jgi:hypothetical protein
MYLASYCWGRMWSKPDPTMLMISLLSGSSPRVGIRSRPLRMEGALYKSGEPEESAMSVWACREICWYEVGDVTLVWDMQQGGDAYWGMQGCCPNRSIQPTTVYSCRDQMAMTGHFRGIECSNKGNLLCVHVSTYGPEPHNPTQSAALLREEIMRIRILSLYWFFR